MSINLPPIPPKNPGNIVNNPDPTVINLVLANNEILSLTETDIRKKSKKLGAIANKMGETNDPEFFGEEMAETILTALRRVQRKQREKKGN